MEWQQIIGFYNVVRFGSFTKAAEATFRTQSALSRQIKSLEDELDCQLLDRNDKRKICLTSAGERFLQFSTAIIEGYDALTEDLGALKNMREGRLKIAAPFTTIINFFLPVIKVYREQFPEVGMTVLDRSQHNVIHLLKNGLIDFGLILDSNLRGELTSIRWKRVQTVLMTPENHPLTRMKKPALADIIKYPLVLPPKDANSPHREDLERRFRKFKINYNVIMESSNVELSFKCVEIGVGIAFASVVPDVFSTRRDTVALLPLDHLFEPDYLVIAMQNERKLPSYKSAFIRMLFEECPGSRVAPS